LLPKIKIAVHSVVARIVDLEVAEYVVANPVDSKKSPD
jgi:hypothetical protein